MTECCNPMTGACEQQHGCPVREKPSCCEFYKMDCQQGRLCPGRTAKFIHQNSDGSDVGMPIVMFDKPLAWIRDIFFTAVYVGGYVCLGVLLLLAFVFATGLHRVLF